MRKAAAATRKGDRHGLAAFIHRSVKVTARGNIDEERTARAGQSSADRASAVVALHLSLARTRNGAVHGASRQRDIHRDRHGVILVAVGARRDRVAFVGLRIFHLSEHAVEHVRFLAVTEVVPDGLIRADHQQNEGNEHDRQHGAATEGFGHTPHSKGAPMRSQLIVAFPNLAGRRSSSIRYKMPISKHRS